MLDLDGMGRLKETLTDLAAMGGYKTAIKGP